MNIGKNKRRRKSGKANAAAAAGSAAGVASPVGVAARPVTSPDVLEQGRSFAEANRQTRPIAASGTPDAGQAAKAVREGTARRHGLHPDTCRRLVTEGTDLEGLFSGPHPKGKAAEVIAALDWRDLHAGRDPGMVNPPGRPASNFKDARLNPDSAGHKDLLFRFRTRGGMLISRLNGQVKTGSARYVADDLVRMAKTPGAGKTGYVDARFVNRDGSPRVAPDAFTESQARRLREAKVRLRGIRDLDKRAAKLLKNIKLHRKDGLDPVARRQLEQLRRDIARAYQWKGVAARMAGGAAAAAATAAIVTLVVQAASDGEVDVAAVGDAAGKAALFGGGGALADACLYHIGTSCLELTAEAAKEFAQNGVAVGFCLLAVGTDLFHEVSTARAGETSFADAVAGSSAKVALDLLPIVFAPLGIAGVPVLVVTQLAGRWAIARVRETDRNIRLAEEKNLRRIAGLHARLDRLEAGSERVAIECADTDRIFAAAMSGSGAAVRLFEPNREPVVTRGDGGSRGSRETRPRGQLVEIASRLGSTAAPGGRPRGRPGRTSQLRSTLAVDPPPTASDTGDRGGNDPRSIP